MFTLDDAVERYRERRRKRVDGRAIEAYLKRRMDRIQKRFDDDEDTNNGGQKGGHGNTRIPFGLCQREGIQIDPSWTPKDAWSALEGKGYSAGEVYKELKKTGKAGKSSGSISPEEAQKSYKAAKKEVWELDRKKENLASQVFDLNTRVQMRLRNIAEEIRNGGVYVKLDPSGQDLIDGLSGEIINLDNLGNYYKGREVAKILEGKADKVSRLKQEIKDRDEASSELHDIDERIADARKREKAAFKEYAKSMPKTSLTESHFPAAMTAKAFRKNTMEFADYINSHCDDAIVTKMLSLGTSLSGKIPKSIVCKRSASIGSHAVTTYSDPSTHLPSTIEITIPNFAKIKDEHFKEQAVRTFAHEWTHYIDEIARDEEKFSHYSETDGDLLKAVEDDDGKVGSQVQKMFDEFNAEYERLRKEKKETVLRRLKSHIKENYLDGLDIGVNFVTEDGYIDWGRFYSAMAKVPRMKEAGERASLKMARDLEKDVNRIVKDCSIEYAMKARSYMDGVESLQGLYDSLNGGRLRAKGIVKYGHSESYFRRNPENKVIEMLASYAALKATNPKMARYFEKDKPEIARAMGETLEGIIRKLEGI